jgi:predicted lysophospholipase L1 biosynthesis ABC-type transport system permease subunit
MTLRTYFIFGVVAFLTVAIWLDPEATYMLLLAAACLAAALVFYYVIGRLFWAIVRRSERRE